MNFRMIIPAAVIAFGAFFFGTRIYVGLVGLPLDWDEIRDWIGALSGWAAAIVAYFTIRPLWDQMKQTATQTRYLVGADMPTVQILPSQGENSAEIRVVNWNRNAFQIWEMQWHCKTPLKTHHKLRVVRDINGDREWITFADYTDGLIETEITIPGWEDRASPPHVIIIIPHTELVDVSGFYYPDLYAIQARIRVSGTLIGSQHEDIEISATAALFTVLSPLDQDNLRSNFNPA